MYKIKIGSKEDLAYQLKTFGQNLWPCIMRSCRRSRAFGTRHLINLGPRRVINTSVYSVSRRLPAGWWFYCSQIPSARSPLLLWEMEGPQTQKRLGYDPNRKKFIFILAFCLYSTNNCRQPVYPITCPLSCMTTGEGNTEPDMRPTQLSIHLDPLQTLLWCSSIIYLEDTFLFWMIDHMLSYKLSMNAWLPDLERRVPSNLNRFGSVTLMFVCVFTLKP